ncbi:MAG: hypothetical protein ACFB2Z_07510 [Maricaulaceae bacterium]
MRSTLLALVVASLAAPVTAQSATTDDRIARLRALAGELGAQTASYVEAATTDAAAPPTAFAPGAPFVDDAQTFANLARRVARDLDAEQGPADLACIYRGMAAELSQQLDQLREADYAGAQITSLTALSIVFRDAVEIDPNQIGVEPAQAACPADPDLRDYEPYFTEQP